MKKKVENTPTNKTVEIVEEENGRRSVKVNVGTLDLEKASKSDVEAKKIIERDVLPQLNQHKVLAIVIHKPTNMKTHGVVPFPKLHQYALNCIAGFPEQEGGKKRKKDFVLVTVDGDNVETHPIGD